ncbi:MAG: hypothetical protein HQM02_02830 [Magnetococcales bacterium]|nr:hypothetical protein [Magnetococcales bacterium]
MMISASTVAASYLSGGKSVGSTRTEQTGGGFGPEYQLDLSSQAREEGLAVSSAATGITATRMRNVLTRILLETLFGMDAPEERNGRETSEEELVREVALEPAMEEQLQKLSTQIVV